MAKFNFNAGNVIMMLVLALAGIYLFGQLFTDTGDGYEFGVPEGGVEPLMFKLIQFGIIGFFTWIGFKAVTKFQGTRLTRKDWISLILMGVAVYFIWTYLFQPMWGVSSIDEITWKFGQKLGLL